MFLDDLLSRIEGLLEEDKYSEVIEIFDTSNLDYALHH